VKKEEKKGFSSEGEGGMFEQGGKKLFEGKMCQLACAGMKNGLSPKIMPRKM